MASDADALLDVAIVDAGYRGTLVLPYRPYMFVVVRLVNPRTRQTLYADRLEYDPTVGAMGFRTVARTDPSCNFSTKEKLRAGMEKAGECLGTGATQIARAIAGDLQRR